MSNANKVFNNILRNNNVQSGENLIFKKGEKNDFKEKY